MDKPIVFNASVAFCVSLRSQNVVQKCFLNFLPGNVSSRQTFPGNSTGKHAHYDVRLSSAKVRA